MGRAVTWLPLLRCCISPKVHDDDAMSEEAPSKRHPPAARFARGHRLRNKRCSKSSDAALTATQPHSASELATHVSHDRISIPSGCEQAASAGAYQPGNKLPLKHPKPRAGGGVPPAGSMAVIHDFQVPTAPAAEAAGGEAAAQPAPLCASPAASQVSEVHIPAGVEEAGRLPELGRSYTTSLLCRTIFRQTFSSELSGNTSWSLPSSSLLDASTIRLSRHGAGSSSGGRSSSASSSRELRSPADARGVAQCFADLFVAAVTDGNCRWAADGRLAGLFHEEAKLVMHDKQICRGRAAIIRRLNRGVEQLVSLIQAQKREGKAGQQAGKDSDLKISISVPDRRKLNASVVATYLCRWGHRRFQFQDQLWLDGDNKIRRLKRVTV